VRSSLLHQNRVGVNGKKNLKRFLCNLSDVSEGIITLRDDEIHHLRNVLRLKVGDSIIVTPRSSLTSHSYECTIKLVSRNCVVCEIIRETKVITNAPITIIQAIPKGRKMDSIVRMACEMGVSNIIPIITRKVTIKTNLGHRIERWRKIAESASKQSHVSVPTIHEAVELCNLDLLHLPELRIAFYEMETVTLKSVVAGCKKPEPIALLIGPESGLTETEVETLKRLKFKTASLGNTILRTETAGTVAIAAILYHFSKR